MRFHSSFPCPYLDFHINGNYFRRNLYCAELAVYIRNVKNQHHIGCDTLFKTLKADLDAVMERDPAARNRAEVFFLYSGFKAVRSHRKATGF